MLRAARRASTRARGLHCASRMATMTVENAMPTGARRRVAIACQGGGSHTAFTAGVLEGLMAWIPNDVEVVALSGTSGGAICAALAWDGLVRNDPYVGVRKLQGFWKAMSASDPFDQIINQTLMGIMDLRDLMVMPEVSPYHFPTWGEDRFRAILNEYFAFAELRELAHSPGAPILRIGAVEVLSGHFELFSGEDLSPEVLLASAAIPELFRAVHVPGRGVYWDGLFSQNPPIHDFIEYEVDEIWVIQINSSTCARIPTETHEILDRRNALAGNLSLEQEVSFIEMLNRAIANGRLKDSRYHPITVERIPMDRELGYRSKLNRSPTLLDELREFGKTKCRSFLKQRETKLARGI
jgi:NTE family protein